MAASLRLGISPKQILPLSLLLLMLLLPPSPLRSVTAADTSSPETLNNDGCCMEKKFSICKLTGHFRVQFFGVVVECPEVDAPKLEPISGATAPRRPDPSHPSNTAAFNGGVHQPPVSPALVRNRPTEKGDTKADAAGISDEL